WGEQLRPVIESLGRWARPLMIKPAPRDEFRSHWLAMPLETLLADRAPKKAPLQIELRVGDDPMVLETSGGGVRVRPGVAVRPAATLTGAPDVVIGLLAGRIDLATARARKLRFEGDVGVLKRIGPAA